MKTPLTFVRTQPISPAATQMRRHALALDAIGHEVALNAINSLAQRCLVQPAESRRARAIAAMRACGADLCLALYANEHEAVS